MQRGHTMSELLVVLAVAATLSGVAVPSLAWVEGRAAVRADAAAPGPGAAPRASARRSLGRHGHACGSTARAEASSASRPAAPPRRRRVRRVPRPLRHQLPRRRRRVPCPRVALLAVRRAARRQLHLRLPRRPVDRSCCRWEGVSDGARRPRHDAHRGGGGGGRRDGRRGRRFQRHRRGQRRERQGGRPRGGRSRCGGRDRGAAQPAVRRPPAPTDRLRPTSCRASFPTPTPRRDSPDATFAPEPRAGCPAGTFFTVKSAAGRPHDHRRDLRRRHRRRLGAGPRRPSRRLRRAAGHRAAVGGAARAGLRRLAGRRASRRRRTLGDPVGPIPAGLAGSPRPRRRRRRDGRAVERAVGAPASA